MTAPDAIRGYLRELRDRQHISQRDVAERIGLSLRAYLDWETGRTDELKGSLLVQTMKVVQGDWQDIDAFDAQSTLDDGRTAALHRFIKQHQPTQERDAALVRAAAERASAEQAQAAALLRQLADVIEAGDIDLERLLATRR